MNPIWFDEILIGVSEISTPNETMKVIPFFMNIVQSHQYELQLLLVQSCALYVMMWNFQEWRTH